MECPRCGQVLNVKNLPAGQSVTCPVCAAQFDPSASAEVLAAQASPRPLHAPTVMTNEVLSRPATGLRNSIIAVAVILLFFIMLGFFFFVHGGSPNTSPDNRVLELPSKAAERQILPVGAVATLAMPKTRPDVPDGGYVSLDKRDVDNVRLTLAGNWGGKFDKLVNEKRVFLLKNTFPVKVVENQGPVAKIIVLESSGCPFSGQTGFVPALWLHEVPTP